MQAVLTDSRAAEGRLQLANDMTADASSLRDALRVLREQEHDHQSSKEYAAKREEAMSKLAQALCSTHSLYEAVSATLEEAIVACGTEVQQAKVALRAVSQDMQDSSVFQELRDLCADVLQKYALNDAEAPSVALEVDMWQLEMHDKLQQLDNRRAQQIDELQQLHAEAIQELNGADVDDLQRERSVQGLQRASL